MAKTMTDTDPSSLQKMRAPHEQTAAMSDDWLDMVKSHHTMIENAFDAVLADDDGEADSRQQRFKRLALLLTAHCVAEENVLYPALAMCGLTAESDKLYMDQAHAKVVNSLLDMADDKGSPGWLEKVRELKEMVLQHAREDEENDLFPRLQAGLDTATAMKLGAAYRREFMSVKPG